MAPSANRVSDYLGVLFRRGLLSRVPAGGGEGEHGRARWAYMWRERVTPEWKRQTRTEPIDYRPKPLLDRPNLHISEDGTHLLLETPELSIQIQLTPRKR